ncbi:MAG: hypothetical protein ABIJ12_00200 [bacterium]
MRKLVLLVCILVALPLLFTSETIAGVIPTWESPSGKLGFYPISNEISYYKNYDDAGEGRGTTLQFVMINSFKFFTTFNFEFTADYNFDLTYDFDNNDYMNDHYIELSLVKPITSLISINYQRVISSFETESINQFGLRLTF